jgi:tetratricopeptide (TPR) repeat protein
MLKVVRPATMSDRTVNRAILVVGLLLLLGIPAFAVFYWNDRAVSSGAPIADQAIAQAEAAVKADPQDLSARDYLAAAYVSAKRTQDGIDQFSEVLKVDASDRAALLGRGIAYLGIGKLDAAATDFEKFIADNGSGEMAKTDPQLEQAYYELGVVQLKQGEAAAAAETLQKGLAINGADADALYSLGTALVQTGDTTKAISALRLAASFVPTGWCDPYQELVTAYTAAGSADGTAWANGMVAMCQGQPDAAETALKPLTSGPMKLDALMGLGYAAAQRGDNAAAIAYFDQVIAIDPSNQSASIALESLGAPASAAPSPAASSGAEGND